MGRPCTHKGSVSILIDRVMVTIRSDSLSHLIVSFPPNTEHLPLPALPVDSVHDTLEQFNASSHFCMSTHPLLARAPAADHFHHNTSPPTPPPRSSPAAKDFNPPVLIAASDGQDNATHESGQKATVLDFCPSFAEPPLPLQRCVQRGSNLSKNYEYGSMCRAALSSAQLSTTQSTSLWPVPQIKPLSARPLACVAKAKVPGLSSSQSQVQNSASSLLGTSDRVYETPVAHTHESEGYTALFGRRRNTEKRPSEYSVLEHAEQRGRGIDSTCDGDNCYQALSFSRRTSLQISGSEYMLASGGKALVEE